MSEFVQKILREGTETTKNILPKDFLECLSGWLMEYNPQKANKIVKYSTSLPSLFKTATKTLYRVVVWKKGLKGFKESIRSWSSSLKEVQELGSNGTVEAFGDELEVIFKIQTDPSRIILNLASLGKSTIFKKSYNYWESKGELYVDASFEPRVLSHEKEIIYKQPVLTEKDIFLIKFEGQWIKANPKFGTKNFFK